MQSACWAMAKSWLDVQVDLELARLRPGGIDHLKNYGDIVDGSSKDGESESQLSVGPENWPFQVLNQQPRQLSALLQKLHSGYAYDTDFVDIIFPLIFLNEIFLIGYFLTVISIDIRHFYFFCDLVTQYMKQ